MNIQPGQCIYLCLVTWPDGREGLLFPRPGNVDVADNETVGCRDYVIASAHLNAWAKQYDKIGENWKTNGTKVRLIKFQALEVLAEHVHGE